MHSDDLARAGADDYYDDDEHEPCSKKIMPALFAWFLLISTSASYFTLVLPEYINLVGLENLHFFVSVTAVHGVLFLFVLLNFSIATFMDPGRFPKMDIKDVIEDNGKSLFDSKAKWLFCYKRSTPEILWNVKKLFLLDRFRIIDFSLRNSYLRLNCQYILIKLWKNRMIW